MKKIIALATLCFMTINVNFMPSAKANELRVDSNMSYSLDSDYKNNFLVKNEFDLSSSTRELKSNKPHSGVLALNFLFPGLGSIAYGDSAEGYTFLTLGLLPIIGSAIAFSMDTVGLYRGLGAFLISVLLFLPIFAIVYLVSLFRTIYRISTTTNSTKPEESYIF